ncbi:MAG: NADH-quinone oxidoreductase subunit M [Bacteroidota bacterium]
MFDSWILSLVIFFPLVGVLFILFLRQEQARSIKIVGIAAALIDFFISAYLYVAFDPQKPAMQFVGRMRWIEGLNVSYFVGVDGISLLLIVLTTLLTPIALLSSWNAITRRLKEYVVFMLLLEVGMVGVFSSLDLFLFYIFWEGMLIPMYFIIGIWGGENRIYAAIKFFLFTLVGSLLMLVAIISLALYASSSSAATGVGGFTTDLLELYRIAPTLPLGIQTWMFLAFALSFAIKVPIFPFHTWLPDAHVEAPTAGSVILAGVLLKMGTYGLLRFCLPLFPQAAMKFMPLVAILAVIGIVYGALVSMVQKDIKKLVAYSSVSHLGFVVLGIFAMNEEAIQGSLIQMVNHGLSTGALFLIVGMIYERRHTREITEFGGLCKVMPVLATFFMIISLSSIGLPGLNGFVGEFLILLGSFQSRFLNTPTYAILAASGVVLSAVYILWMYQRVMFGSVTKAENQSLKDLSVREIAVLVPIAAFVFWIGIYPSSFLGKSAASTKALVQQVERELGVRSQVAQKLTLPNNDFLAKDRK